MPPHRLPRPEIVYPLDAVSGAVRASGEGRELEIDLRLGVGALS